MSTNLKNILVWLAVVVSLVLLWQLFYNIRDVNVEEKGKTYPFNVILIENYDVRQNSYQYEIECISCKQKPQASDVNNLEMELEGYLLDNAVDILSEVKE